ncbi:MAG: DsrE family protein [Methylococcales bacterium]|nr:DsrE family protein [Methylococcales bacterium]
MKNFLFVLRKPSYNGLYIQEMLDIILTTAAFEQNVSVLLLDDAVFHLKTGQNAQKNTATMFELLPTMDITDIFVETESLETRGLNAQMLTQKVQLKTRATICEFMSQFDTVFAG